MADRSHEEGATDPKLSLRDPQREFSGECSCFRYWNEQSPATEPNIFAGLCLDIDGFLQSMDSSDTLTSTTAGVQHPQGSLYTVITNMGCGTTVSTSLLGLKSETVPKHHGVTLPQQAVTGVVSTKQQGLRDCESFQACLTTSMSPMNFGTSEQHSTFSSFSSEEPVTMTAAAQTPYTEGEVRTMTSNIALNVRAQLPIADCQLPQRVVQQQTIYSTSPSSARLQV